jgi:hypothetical protein
VSPLCLLKQPFTLLSDFVDWKESVPIDSRAHRLLSTASHYPESIRAYFVFGSRVCIPLEVLREDGDLRELLRSVRLLLEARAYRLNRDLAHDGGAHLG